MAVSAETQRKRKRRAAQTAGLYGAGAATGAGGMVAGHKGNMAGIAVRDHEFRRDSSLDDAQRHADKFRQSWTSATNATAKDPKGGKPTVVGNGSERKVSTARHPVFDTEAGKDLPKHAASARAALKQAGHHHKEVSRQAGRNRKLVRAAKVALPVSVGLTGAGYANSKRKIKKNDPFEVAKAQMTPVEQVRRADVERRARYLQHYQGFATKTPAPSRRALNRKLARASKVASVVKSVDPFELSKAKQSTRSIPGVVEGVANSARGRVFVGTDKTHQVRTRMGGWMLKPKTTVLTRDSNGNTVMRSTSGGGLTGKGYAVTGAGAAGAGYGAKRAHDKRYASRKPKTKTVKVKIKKGLEMSSMSAFGVEHGGEVSKALPGFGAAKVGAKKIGQGQFSGGAKAIGIGGQQAGRAGTKALKPIGAKVGGTWNRMGTGAKVGLTGGAAAAGGFGIGASQRRRSY